MIDSHCHLADDVFAEDLGDVVARAKAAGLEAACCILAAGDEGEAARATQVATAWPEVRFAVGVHPHNAEQFGDRASDVTRNGLAASSGACAVGEIGLDYHYDYSERGVQQEVFRAQVALARELKLPVIVHTREADEDTLRILRTEGGGRLQGVIHCFTGGPDLARGALDLGFYISLAGIVTFPRAAELRDTAKLVPDDRLLVETDSPFLAPVPHRGKRNEPSWVARVIEVLAETRGTTAAELATRTSANFRQLFGGSIAEIRAGSR
ncbi:MAG TPA: TatD family hydrolase [Vicinamibacterales bacterium]|nr:TatD family hydrolase [Vicinamibacterales bacterium]